ncbi:MAG: hypothetical protein MJY55_04125 [Bacteroidales bacterium]|nr:hypothetical protein [Bacteroidales bacterium]
MARKDTQIILGLLLAVFLPCASLSSQAPDTQEDKVVRLMSAQSVRLLEKDGQTYRKADGPARFLHNDTWLVCDTALWDVDRQIIHAMGHVSIEQDRTELLSDSLTYFIERNVAEFRGTLVQLQDKDGNILRTHYLDYNTKDSTAVFTLGAAMRDKDGQLIESNDGTYDAKRKLFTFSSDVNMFTDSTFVKTEKLKYDSRTSTAYFDLSVDAWKEDDMLSGDSGWWDRNRELFFFTGNVHAMSRTQEGWSDSLYVHRSRRNVEMLGNAQVTDTVRCVMALAGRICYCDSLSRVEMIRDPAVLMEVTEKKDSVSKTDTVYFRADTLAYWTLPRYRVDSTEIASSAKRVEEISSDPVANIRAKAAEEAAKKYQEAIDADPNADPTLKTEYKEKMAAKAAAQADSLKAEREALDKYIYSAAADSLSAADSAAVALADSISVAPLDSTAIGFLSAMRGVRVYRDGMQAVCDSLLYSDIDSLARMFKDPIVWNDIRHQYSADSIYLAIRDGRMERAHLLSDAFIHIDEGEKYYDQIRGTEMTAYFDDKSQLKRFDAMGGSNAIFFFKEKGDRISTANKKESTMMSAEFTDGEISRITYFETPKSNAFPVAQMLKEDLRLKGFNWLPDLRPTGPVDLTARVPRAPQRREYDAHPRASFRQTEIYFKGYMAQVYRQIERSDSLRRARNAAPAVEAGDTLSAVDSGMAVTAVSAGSVGVALAALTAEQLQENLDSLAIASADAESLVPEETPVPVIDSLLAVGSRRKAVRDSLASIKTPEQLKKEARQAERERKAAERKTRSEERQAALEKKWAEADARDAAKEEEKAARRKARKDAKIQRKTDAVLQLKAKEDAMTAAYREKYLEKYRRTGIPKQRVNSRSGREVL